MPARYRAFAYLREIASRRAWGERPLRSNSRKSSSALSLKRMPSTALILAKARRPTMYDFYGALEGAARLFHIIQCTTFCARMQLQAQLESPPFPVDELNGLSRNVSRRPKGATPPHRPKLSPKVGEKGRVCRTGTLLLKILPRGFTYEFGTGAMLVPPARGCLLTLRVAKPIERRGSCYLYTVCSISLDPIRTEERTDGNKKRRQHRKHVR
jgi:hypothetical protein